MCSANGTENTLNHVEKIMRRRLQSLEAQPAKWQEYLLRDQAERAPHDAAKSCLLRLVVNAPMTRSKLYARVPAYVLLHEPMQLHLAYQCYSPGLESSVKK